MRPPTLLKAPGECNSLRQAKVTLQNKHAGQRNGGRLKARNHRDSDIQGIERWCGFPCKSTLWPSQFYTHSSIHSHIMDTHKETIFTGSEVVETGKQAEGRKKILLCKPFKDWAVVTANLIPNSSQHNLREKQPNTHWHDDSNGCDGIRTYCV